MSNVVDLIEQRLPVLQDLAGTVKRVEEQLTAFSKDETAPSFRALAEQLVEEVIALLDKIDGDPDLEPEQEVHFLPNGTPVEFDDSDDEPSLGATEDINQVRAWKNGRPDGPFGVDLEQGDEREGDELDRLEGDDSDIAGESDGLESEDGAPVNEDYRRRLFERRRQSGAHLDNVGPVSVPMPVIFDPETGEPYSIVRIDTHPCR
jgi:hypothetical protein